MNDSLRPTQLFIALVNRNNGNKIIHAIRKAGAGGCTRLTGLGYPGQANALFNVHDVLLSLLYNETEPIMKAVESTCKDHQNIRALALLANAQKGAPGAALEPAVPLKESLVKLIVGIVNSGKAKSVMRAARQAGATGGTVIKAQGTGTKEDVKFFGISLVPEKDVLLIVSGPDNSAAVFDAVNSHPVFQEQGGGIAFALDVTSLRSLNIENGFEDWIS